MEQATATADGAGLDVKSGEQETKLARRVGPILLLFFILGGRVIGIFYNPLLNAFDRVLATL